MAESDAVRGIAKVPEEVTNEIDVAPLALSSLSPSAVGCPICGVAAGRGELRLPTVRPRSVTTKCRSSHRWVLPLSSSPDQSASSPLLHVWVVPLSPSTQEGVHACAGCVLCPACVASFIEAQVDDPHFGSNDRVPGRPLPPRGFHPPHSQDTLNRVSQARTLARRPWSDADSTSDRPGCL